MKKLVWAGIFLFLMSLVYFSPQVEAEGVIHKVKVEQTAEQFIAQFTALFDVKTGVLKGPFDVIIGTTDKGANGVKYSNVPYVLMLNNGMVVFPNGDNGKGNKPVLVISSNATIRTK
jgi:hypothetical protein